MCLVVTRDKMTNTEQRKNHKQQVLLKAATAPNHPVSTWRQFPDHSKGK